MRPLFFSHPLFVMFYLQLCAVSTWAAEAVPAATAADILADPASAVLANQEANQSMMEAFASNPYFAWGAMAFVTVLGIARYALPGVWGLVAKGAYAILAPQAEKLLAKETKNVAAVGHVVVSAIESLDNNATIADLKEMLMKNMDQDHKDAVETVVSSIKKHGKSLTSANTSAG